MDLESIIGGKQKQEIQSVLCKLLRSYLKPAFGALPKREVDLIFLDSLVQLDAIDRDPAIYDLVSKLKINRSKARSLYYDYELRRTDNKQIECKAIEALKRPILQKQGELFVFEIDNPLISEHIRHMFREIGHATDGSFLPSLVRVSGDAFIQLLSHRLSAEAKDAVRDALVKAGAPDTSLKGVLRAALGTLGKRIASDAGEALSEDVSRFVEPLWDATHDKIYTVFGKLFAEASEAQ